DILIHLKEFLKFTKKEYLEEIENIKIEIKQNKRESNKLKLKNKLNILNEEYKLLINQKIKDLSLARSNIEKEIIENTYKEIEDEKKKNISYLQSTMKKNKKEQLEERMEQIKTAVEYFNEIIDLEKLNKMI